MAFVLPQGTALCLLLRANVEPFVLGLLAAVPSGLGLTQGSVLEKLLKAGEALLAHAPDERFLLLNAHSERDGDLACATAWIGGHTATLPEHDSGRRDMAVVGVLRLGRLGLGAGRRIGGVGRRVVARRRGR